MNYIPQICEMLGVAWDEENQCSEEFELADATFNPYRFTLNGLESRSSRDCPFVLDSLIKGKSQIIRQPWKPKVGESYFCANITNPELYSSYRNNVRYYTDFHVGNGLVFQTKEEAVAKAEEILEMLKGGK